MFPPPPSLWTVSVELVHQSEVTVLKTFNFYIQWTIVRTSSCV